MGTGGWMWHSVTRRSRPQSQDAVGLRSVAIRYRRRRQAALSRAAKVGGDSESAKTNCGDAEGQGHEVEKTEEVGKTEAGKNEVSDDVNVVSVDEKSDDGAADQPKFAAKLNVDLVDVSEALLLRTHYPKLTKPHARLDALLEKRKNQFELEMRNKTVLSQALAKYHSQRAAGAKAAEGGASREGEGHDAQGALTEKKEFKADAEMSTIAENTVSCLEEKLSEKKESVPDEVAVEAESMPATGCGEELSAAEGKAEETDASRGEEDASGIGEAGSVAGSVAGSDDKVAVSVEKVLDAEEKDEKDVAVVQEEVTCNEDDMSVTEETGSGPKRIASADCIGGMETEDAASFNEGKMPTEDAASVCMEQPSTASAAETDAFSVDKSPNDEEMVSDMSAVEHLKCPVKLEETMSSEAASTAAVVEDPLTMVAEVPIVEDSAMEDVVEEEKIGVKSEEVEQSVVGGEVGSAMEDVVEEEIIGVKSEEVEQSVVGGEVSSAMEDVVEEEIIGVKSEEVEQSVVGGEVGSAMEDVVEEETIGVKSEEAEQSVVGGEVSSAMEDMVEEETIGVKSEEAEQSVVGGEVSSAMEDMVEEETIGVKSEEAEQSVVGGEVGSAVEDVQPGLVDDASASTVAAAGLSMTDEEKASAAQEAKCVVDEVMARLVRDVGLSLTDEQKASTIADAKSTMKAELEASRPTEDVKSDLFSEDGMKAEAPDAKSSLTDEQKVSAAEEKTKLRGSSSVFPCYSAACRYAARRGAQHRCYSVGCVAAVATGGSGAAAGGRMGCDLPNGLIARGAADEKTGESFHKSFLTFVGRDRPPKGEDAKPTVGEDQTAGAVPPPTTGTVTTAAVAAAPQTIVSGGGSGPSILAIQSLIQDGRLQLTADNVVELAVKLAAVGDTRHQTSLARFVRRPRRAGTPAVPAVHRFIAPSGRRSLFVMERRALRRLARAAGRRDTPPGFSRAAKATAAGWPYPCPRALFCTAWHYRTLTARSLAAAAVQLRVLWACVRWDDMAVKPPAAGTTTRTTEADITTTELLRRRDVCPDMLRSEFLVRKLVVPIGITSTPKGRRRHAHLKTGPRTRRINV